MAVDLPEPWRERGRNERGDEREKKMMVFWSIYFNKHIEEISNDMFRRVVNL